jgi:hypothetical protein
MKKLIEADAVKDLLCGLEELPWEENVDYLVDTLPTVEVPSWIPVTEQLPECGNLVLAIDRDGLMSTAYYVGRWHGMLDENTITHWMPLPDPPAGDE